MAKEGLSIIGEVKKASPSRGLIKPDFHPVEIAKEYVGAVDAISVLTEEDYFQGSPLFRGNSQKCRFTTFEKRLCCFSFADF